MGQPVVPTPDTSLGGFHNIQPYLYWSCAGQHVQRDCSGSPAPGFGWSFSFNNGFTDTTVKADDLYVTAYYPGQSKATTTMPICTPPTAGKPNACM